MGQITTTAAAMSGGVREVTGVAKRYRVQYTGTYALDDLLLLTMTDSRSAIVERAGYGPLTAKTPLFLLTYNDKMNLLAGTQWFFSAIDTPTAFNHSFVGGNGNIQMANTFAMPENLAALAPYQGRMAVLGRNSTQIRSIDADPSLYKQLQVLDNVGTLAALSVRAIGELDVLFLMGSGIRSLRVRDSSLNAFVDDSGSPIDLLVQEKIAAASATERAAACGIAEPNTGRYWLFLKDTIYVRSHFQSAKVLAWSTYEASYQSANVMEFFHTSELVFYVKISMVNDASKAHFTVGPVSASNAVDIAPGNYIFLVDADGNLLDSSAITDGVRFRGHIEWDDATGTFTFTSNQTSFTPQKFFTLDGQVFARTATGIVAYGGTTGESFDNAVASLKTPWLDADSSEVKKTAEGVNVSMTGAWYAYASMDYLSEGFTEIVSAQSNPTYDGGNVGFPGAGTHFAFQAVTNAASRAVLSALTLKYK